MSFSNIFDLKNKTILLTGASGYLGKNYALGLSEYGANVILSDLDYEGCKKLERQIKNDFNTEPLAIKTDLTKPNSIKNTVKKSLQKFPKIDVLINNAAYQGDDQIRTTPFEQLPLKVWNKAISVNLTGVFLLTQKVGDIMKEQGYGNIINISSTYGLVAPDQRIYGKSGQNAAIFYTATKSAIIGMTRYQASYWSNSGIRVNCLTPGGVKKNQLPSFVKSYSKKTMIGRMANNNEYVGAIIFLCSDASSYMTGSNLIIDGGWTAW